jgi:hypothetical protein
MIQYVLQFGVSDVPGIIKLHSFIPVTSHNVKRGRGLYCLSIVARNSTDKSCPFMSTVKDRNRTEGDHMKYPNSVRRVLSFQLPEDSTPESPELRYCGEVWGLVTAENRGQVSGHRCMFVHSVAFPYSFVGVFVMTLFFCFVVTPYSFVFQVAIQKRKD